MTSFRVPERVFPNRERSTGVPAPDGLEDPVARLQGADAAIILPTLNEEEGLRRTLEELPAALAQTRFLRVEPLVIDGGSTDGTVSVARAAGIPVLTQRTRGKGAAVVEAFERVGALGARYGVVLDADATYPPDAIGPTLSLLQRGTDLVVGVRSPIWGPPKDFRDLIHRVGNVALSYSASLLTRRSILDLCSGFWGISTAHFLELGISSDSFAVEAELVLKALRQGLAFRQIPIDYRERIGRAKLKTIRDGSRIFFSILNHGRRSIKRAHPAPSMGAPVPHLLSIWVISGAPSATVEAHPSRHVEADRLARALEREGHIAQVRLGESMSSSVAPRIPPNGASENAPSLLISLPSAGSPAVPHSPVTVVLRSQHRRLTIDLPPEPEDRLSLPLDVPEAHLARSGGFLSRFGLGASSSAVLKSRLDLDPLHRKQVLLGANGFPATEEEESLTSTPTAPPLLEPPAPRLVSTP